MRQITLTKLAIRVVEVNVSLKADGFKPRENIRWREIADKLLAAAADYDTPVQDLAEQAEEIQADPALTDAERAEKIHPLNAAQRELDATLGQESVTLVLDSGEVEFIKRIWVELPFRGDRKLGARVRAITNALDPRSDANPDGAVEVSIVDGQLVPAASGERPGATANGKAGLTLAKGHRR